MIYNKKFETMPRDDLRQIQLERLQAGLNRVQRNVAFYGQLFEIKKIDITRIRDMSDISKLPFTVKDDLLKAYPYDLFAVPLKDIVRIHSSSGTTGKAIVAGYTRNDLKTWSESVARLLVSAGVTEHDFVQIAFDYSLFTGGFGFHAGAELIGASVIPSSSGTNLEKQVMILRDFKTSVLVCTPGYAIAIMKTLKRMGIQPRDLRLRVGVFGAEPWSEKVRQSIETGLSITSFDTYGLSEIMGPGVSGECGEKHGLHINEDQFIVEVIDPETHDPLPEGKEGELVITNIAKEGCPLFRYRTGDITSLDYSPCKCGRTTVRMSRVMRRTDDMIIFRGIKVFPSQIENVLAKAEGIEPQFRIVLDNSEGEDTMEVQIEISEGMDFDEVRRLVEMKARVAEMLERELGLMARVSLVEPMTLAAGTGPKSKRVEDRRK